MPPRFLARIRRRGWFLALDVLKEGLDFHGSVVEDPLHRLHPFPARFPPALPRRFIEVLTPTAAVVLDPMAGSGTALLEASRLGRRPVGGDIDPLSLLVMRVKARPPDARQLHEAAHRALHQACSLLRASRTVDEALGAMDPETRSFLDYWFPLETQRHLMALRLAVDDETHPDARRALMVIFSSLIIAKSGSVAMARDISHSRPRRVEKPTVNALEVFARKAEKFRRALEERPSTGETPAWHLFRADARHLPLPSRSVDLIVTSPPYAANAIDYLRAHKFTLVWWGYSLQDLRRLGRRYIGRNHVGRGDGHAFPREAREVLEELTRRDEQRARVLAQYFLELDHLLRESFRVLRPGGLAVFVVGSNRLRGVPTRTDRVLVSLAREVGWAHVGTGYRTLDRDRRMLPVRKHPRRSPGTASSISDIENRMHQEAVVVLGKPDRGRP